MASLGTFFSSLRREPSSKDPGKSSDGIASSTTSILPTFIVLAIDSGTQKADWTKLFENKTVNGRQLKVVQTSWPDIHVSAEPLASHNPSRLIVHVNQTPRLFVQPDVVLVRNEVYTPDIDFRNQLYGLMMGGVPSVNSLHSIFCSCEKAVVTAELFRLNRLLGNEAFPVIPLSYFATHREAMYTGSFPCVAKIGSAHAGMGKMVIKDHKVFEDFRSVLGMTEGKYCTAEPFIEGMYDLRVQKIGSHIRVFKRQSVCGNWKTNTGTSVIEHIEVTETYRRWAEAASEMFGGLDILSVDAIHEESSGKEYILEVNGTSTGLSQEFFDEDNLRIRDLVLHKLSDTLSDTTTNSDHIGSNINPASLGASESKD